MDVPGAIWNAYPGEYLPRQITFLDAAGGFSGAKFWRLSNARGEFLLRRWPQEHPDPLRLAYIHAVLQHAQRRGFARIPALVPTQSGQTFAEVQEHLWELTTWISGSARLAKHPQPADLQAALQAVAEFHRAVSDFPHSGPKRGCSPGLQERAQRLKFYCSGGSQALRTLIQHAEPTDQVPAEIGALAWQLLGLFDQAAEIVARTLRLALEIEAPLQPCIRDLRPEHLLFAGDSVCGLVDFGSLRLENPATDLARLLGDVAADDASLWQLALQSYQQHRPLSAEEQQLVLAFDQTGVLLGGLTWLEWLYRQRRTFPDFQPVAIRLRHYLARLTHLLSPQLRFESSFLTKS